MHIAQSYTRMVVDVAVRGVPARPFVPAGVAVSSRRGKAPRPQLPAYRLHAHRIHLIAIIIEALANGQAVLPVDGPVPGVVVKGRAQGALVQSLHVILVRNGCCCRCRG